MKFKRLLCICLTGAIALSSLCWPVATFAKVDYSSKIDASLAKKLDGIGNDETVKVSVWFNEISENKVEKAVLSDLKQEVKNGRLNSTSLKLHSLEQLSVTDLKESDEKITVQDVQDLVTSERKALSKLYHAHNQECIESVVSENKFNKKDITYVSKYLPNAEMTLTKEEIYSLIESNYVDSIYIKGVISYKKEDGVSKSYNDKTSSNYHLNWQEMTGIKAARDTYGLDGSGIKVGHIESTAVNPNLALFSYAVTNGTLHTYSVNSYNASSSSHADYTASVIIGKSNEYTAAVPNVELYSISSNSNVWKERIEMLVSDGVNLINASTYYLGNIYDGTLGQYNDSAKWIEHLSYLHNVSIFISSGNSGQNSGELTLGANAYNAIAVGNLNEKNTEDTSDDIVVSTYLSSGAYKPDIVAPGSYVGTGISPTMTVGGTSAAAPVATSVAVQLCQSCPGLMLNPQFLKAILLNGATYLGEKNVMNSSDEFVAFDRVSGTGVVNTLKSKTCYATRDWDFGTSAITEANYELYVDSKKRQVSVTVCSLKPAWFTCDSTAMVDPHATYKITVTRGNRTWTSECNTDNKCSVIFDPPVKGTYNIHLERTDGNASSIKTAIVYTSC